MALPHLTQTIHHSVYSAIDPSNPSNSAQGKTVIISGGASGIGYAIARGFAVAGADTVVIIARRQEALDEAREKLRVDIADAKTNTTVWTYLLDITDSTAAHSVFEDIRKRQDEETSTMHARDTEVLVTSAASLLQGDSTLDISSQIYRDSFETNVIGNLNIVRAFLAPELPAIPCIALNGKEKTTRVAQISRRHKIILDVSSGSTYMTLPGQAAYSASKLAFTRAMQHLQRDVDQMAGPPIRIHSFHPGAVLTPGAIKAIGEGKFEEFELDEESLPGGFAVWLTTPAAEFLKGRFVLSNWDVKELSNLRPKFEKDAEYGTITLKV